MISPLRKVLPLLRHYVGLFGARGLILFADRVARRSLPGAAYRPLRPLLWQSGGRSPAGAREGLPAANAVGVSVIPPWLAEDRQWFVERFPKVEEQKVDGAERLCRHAFDFLGTGATQWGDPIDWHLDVKSGHRWPLKFYTAYREDLTPGNGVDVKVPWELSRLHHLATLAQASWLTGERRYSAEVFAQWDSWTASDPWLYGVNWASAMEAAIRVVNLLWAWPAVSDGPGSTPERHKQMERSLGQHGLYIENNLEVSARDGHIVAANHYLANVCALACLGLSCPQLPDAGRWRKVGLKALEQEMRRQVLPDGFFFESSTSYHRLAVELFLVPAVLARRYGHEMTDAYWRQLERMLELILHVTGPDGAVPQIGDNDDGRLLILSGYPDWMRHDHRYLLALGAVLFDRRDFKAAAGDCPEEVYWFLGREGVEKFDSLAADAAPIESRAFPEAGLYVIRSQDGRDYALVRAGSPAHHAPAGHAHDDALSLELWVDGQPVFVDPGTYCYTSDPEARGRLRSTSAHNTVIVDGQEVDHILESVPFGLCRDGSVRVVDWQVQPGGATLTAEHDGFCRLSPPVRHRRTVRYSPNARRWEIEDVLQGKGTHEATWFWHATPGRSPRLEGLEADLGPVRMAWETEETFSLDLRRCQHAPSYGCVLESWVLVGRGIWEDQMLVRTVVEAEVPVKAVAARSKLRSR